MTNIKPGLCSVSFRDNSAEEIIKAVYDAGLLCIEWGSDVHAPCNDVENIRKIVSLQKQYDIFCSSYGTYYTVGKDSSGEIYPYIETARLLGTDILRLWCGTKASSLYGMEEKEELFSVCKSLASIAEKENVILCMEYHNDSFTDTPKSVEELMKAISSPNFRMYWQPDIFIDDETNYDIAQMVAPYSVNIHAFYRINSHPVSLSEGVDVWQRYLEHFKDVKAILLEFMPNNSMQSLKKEAQALKNILNKKLSTN